jgi:chemotaxis protein CheX
VTPNPEQIIHVVKTVWSTQLGLHPEPDASAAAPSTKPTMTGAVHITGAFSGCVRLECSRALIRRAAAIMFDADDDRLTADDERDVIGELANVITGNIKALIPGSNSISLPTIVEGDDYRLSTLNVRSAQDFGFTVGGEPMMVTVVEHGQE